MRAVASGEIAPLSGNDAISTIIVEGYQNKPDENMNVAENWVSPGYFSSMGVALIAGRMEDATPERRTVLAPPARAALERMAERAMAEGREGDASLYRDALSSIEGLA